MNQKDISFLLLSSRVTEETSYDERRSSLAYDYVAYFERLDFTVIPVPCNTTQIENYFSIEPKAVVLTGGNTVSNHGPNEPPEKLPGVFIERDLVERCLLAAAIERRIPVLGICRGMQMINRFFGGRVRHDIKKHIGVDHRIESDSCPTIHGQTTNSFHGDGMNVEDIAECLEIVALSNDGIVEAIAHNEHKIFGIQWHPERQRQPFDDQLIHRLIREQECP